MGLVKICKSEKDGNSVINITTPIDNPMDVPRITKFEVVDVTENDLDATPSISVRIRLYGPGNIEYGSPITLSARNLEQSICLQVNPGQQNYSDLFRTYGTIVPNAYTTISTAWNSNIANPTKRKRCLAVEEVLVGLLLPSVFAGT